MNEALHSSLGHVFALGLIVLAAVVALIVLAAKQSKRLAAMQRLVSEFIEREESGGYGLCSANGGAESYGMGFTRHSETPTARTLAGKEGESPIPCFADGGMASSGMGLVDCPDIPATQVFDGEESGRPVPCFADGGMASSGMEFAGYPETPAARTFAGALPSSCDTNCKSEGRMENWIGRNAIGVIASVLVFLGLVFLGVTVVPQLSDHMKVAAMFLLSAALTVGGSIVAIRRRNGFTCALMGCGAGSLFISVFVIHLFFGMIGEVTAYGLILAWMVMCLALVRKTESLLLSVVVQLGLAISVCLGYYSGAYDGKLALMLVYQVAAGFIVVGGNLVFYRKAYRSSLVLALALCVVASGFMCHALGWRVITMALLGSMSLAGDVVRQDGLFMAGFAMQLVQSSVLFALIIASILSGHRAVEEQQQGGTAIDAEKSAIRALFGLLMAGERASIAHEAYAIHPAVVLLQTISASAFWLTTLRLCMGSLAVLVIYGGGRSLDVTGSQLAMVITAFAQVVAIVACAALVVRRAKRENLECHGAVLRATLIALVLGIAFTIMQAQMQQLFAKGYAPLAWMWVAALCTVALSSQKMTGDTLYRAFALCFLAFDALYLALCGFEGLSSVIGGLPATVIGAFYVAGVGTFSIWLVRMMKPSPAGIVVYAIACTVLLMTYLTANTPLAAEAYRWSICCMACALACVVVGFRLRVKPLRLYGLVLMLACVAKLVLVDAVGLDSLARVGAFVAGGAICFAVSALYNFVARRLDA